LVRLPCDTLLTEISPEARMAAGVKPPIFRSAYRAWADAFKAMRAMPLVIGVGTALMLAIGVLEAAFPLTSILNADGAGQTTLSSTIFPSALANLLTAFLMTPLAIAIHRHVILGEVTRSYRINPSDVRFFKFFGFAFVIVFMQWALLVAGALLFPAGFGAPLPDLSLKTRDDDYFETFGPAVAFILIGVALLLVVLARTIVLFPAIAVDAPHADWRSAWHDTKGSFWRIASIFAIVWLPAFLLSPASTVPVWARVPWKVLDVLMLCIGAAAASRLFLAFADNLGKPPEPISDRPLG
jgi:hypothetical protein